MVLVLVEIRSHQSSLIHQFFLNVNDQRSGCTLDSFELVPLVFCKQVGSTSTVFTAWLDVCGIEGLEISSVRPLDDHWIAHMIVLAETVYVAVSNFGEIVFFCIYIHIYIYIYKSNTDTQRYLTTE